jgi:hypothetical protein
LRIEFENGEVIEGTAQHGIWSESKNSWTTLGKLEAGELVLSHSGPLAVASVAPLQEFSRVFNLEIYGDHVYEVTDSGILVHNNTGGAGGGDDCADLLGDFFKVNQPAEAYNRAKHYPNTPTAGDRNAIGAGKGQVADHDPPLVERYYKGDPKIGEKPGSQMTPAERDASAGDRMRMKVQSQADSNRQGGYLRGWSMRIKRLLGL